MADLERTENRRISYQFLAQMTGSALTIEQSKKAGLEVDPEETDLTLAQVYAKYFRGIYRGHFGLPAYESVWRKEKGEQLSSKVLLSVRAFMIECGARLNVKDQPDYLSAELSLMAWLIAKEEDTGEEKYRKWQQEWLTRHLLGWIPEFCRHLRGSCPSAAYKSLAEYILAFLEEEREEEVK